MWASPPSGSGPGGGTLPGFGALPVGCRTGRRHAHRHAVAARPKPRPLLSADRPDPRRENGTRAGPDRRGVAAGQADGPRLGVGRGPRPPADPAVALHAPPIDRISAPPDAGSA